MNGASMEQCAFPTCDNLEDPRWGGFCDGHGASNQEEWDQLWNGMKAGIRELRAQLQAERERADGLERAEDHKHELMMKAFDERDAALAQVAVLRERLAFAVEILDTGLSPEKRQLLLAERDALSFTASAAQDFVARVRREALEEVLERIEVTRAGSGHMDPGNDVWKEACDTVAELVRGLASKEGGSGK